ncbi:DEAD/DEAH box helicase [Staphylococcus saprophyticus]|uniref:DEAD/DEAH box helicase n=1 Tax=Staphylococcus saprophyticus TaxID=29385 RepID=UPI000E008BA9|nr:SNF2-related protein [Staphylococcus saprophyticus]MDW4327425.1 SNF2-related protein [Staphylococcus saprophyticus]MDW4347332.1 SNF2-related protein [Staphylococcus saprophyticus]SUM72342.1 ATP-dependent RNA helicase DbpA [Staphylococcus saprophyticus]
MIKIAMSNNFLIIKGEAIEIDKIIKTPKYKMRIRKYVESVQNNKIEFKASVYYGDLKSIVSSISQICKQKNIEIEISTNINEYIDDIQTYIDLKYSIGNDIKKRDKRYQEEYKIFNEIVNDAMQRQLRDKQMLDAFYMTMMQKAGNFSVPGSGKTSTVYGMYAYLKKVHNVNRIIMVGPLNSFGSWLDEFESCFGSKEELNHLNIKEMSGSNEKRKKIKYDSGGKNLILVNYEALESIQEEIKNIIDENTMVVFDEVHRIKNPEGKRAYFALNIIENAKYVVALTGTPIPNGYQDIYNLLNLLYPYDYKHFFKFDLSTLKRPSEDEVEIINDKIRPFFTRTTKHQLNVPQVNADKFIKVNANEEEKELFKLLFSTYKKNQFALFAKISQMESVPKMLLQTTDLKDFSNMFDFYENDIDLIEYQDNSQDIERLVNQIDISSKLKTLLKLVDSINNEAKTMIVWCIFIKSMTTIKRYLDKMGIKAAIISGDVDQQNRNEIIKGFKNKEIDVLITNPHTLAESVSLHKTCHDAIYFEYSFNLVHLLQSKDRIHRLGLKDEDYTQYYYLQQYYELDQGEYSLGEKVYERLTEKEQVMLEAIDNDKLEILPTDDEDLDFFFKNVFH